MQKGGVSLPGAHILFTKHGAKQRCAQSTKEAIAQSAFNVTKENFKTEVLEAKTPVLVDFWAPWCGYCRRIGPAVDALAAEYAGKVAVGKVNVDEQPELAEQFKVMTIPSLFVFQNGEHGEAIIAPGSKAQIEEFMRAQGAL